MKCCGITGRVGGQQPHLAGIANWLITTKSASARAQIWKPSSLLLLSPFLSVVHVERSRCHMSSCPHSQCPNMHSYTAGGDSKHHGGEQDLSTCTWEPSKQKFYGSMLHLDDNLEQKRLFRWTISGLRELLPQRFKRLHGAARIKNHKCFISWRAEGAGNLGRVWQAQLFFLVHTPTHKYWIWILLHL